MTGHRIDFFPVVVPSRPADMAPADFTPANARLARAEDVVAGDLVLGYVLTLPGGRQVVDYHDDAYAAAPVPHIPGCDCPGHSVLTAEDTAGPLSVLTDGFPWNACDVMPSSALVLIVPAAKPAPLPTRTTSQKKDMPVSPTTLPKLRKSGDGWTFTHNGTACTAFRNSGDPQLWDVYADGKPLATRRASRSQAIGDAIAVLDGDTSSQTGFDQLASLLVL